MVNQARPSLTLPLPTLAGLAAGVLVGAAAALAPTGALEAMTQGSGIAALLPAAAPPLGGTARAVLALGGGLCVAGLVWAVLFLLVSPDATLPFRGRTAGDAPSVRRADAHPDAPPRRPISAAELTAATIELPLPADLDLPLAAVDPASIPAVPREPVRALKPLAPALAPGERLETFTLTPPPPVAPRSDETPSIDALLRRLEQGARRRAIA